MKSNSTRRSRLAKRAWYVRERKHIFFELLLIFGAVLIFRGIWTLMDKTAILSMPSTLALMAIIGFVITVVSLEQLFKHEKEH
jgi:hypothetical protein